jgi:hypothetical protein
MEVCPVNLVEWLVLMEVHEINFEWFRTIIHDLHHHQQQ